MKVNKKVAVTALALAFGLTPMMTHAQFGRLKNKLPGSSSSGSSVSAGSLVSSYVQGSTQVGNAQIKLLEALGLKEEADKVRAANEALTASPTKDNMTDAKDVQTQANKDIADANAKKAELPPESKEKYADGLLDLGKGLLTYSGMGADLQNFKPSPTSADSQTLAAAFIAKNLPGSIKNLQSTLASAIAFAKSNNIKVPEEATGALPD